MVDQISTAIGACIGVGIPVIAGLYLFTRYYNYHYRRRRYQRRVATQPSTPRRPPKPAQSIKKGKAVPPNTKTQQEGHDSKASSGKNAGHTKDRDSISSHSDTDSFIDIGFSSLVAEQSSTINPTPQTDGPSNGGLTAQQEAWIRQGREQFLREQRDQGDAATPQAETRPPAQKRVHFESEAPSAGDAVDKGKSEKTDVEGSDSSDYSGIDTGF